MKTEEEIRERIKEVCGFRKGLVERYFNVNKGGRKRIWDMVKRDDGRIAALRWVLKDE